MNTFILPLYKGQYFLQNIFFLIKLIIHQCGIVKDINNNNNKSKD